MAQRLLPSVHLLELFMPYRMDEARMLRVLQKAVQIPFYRGVELGIFFQAENRHTVRTILEKNCLHGTTYAMPYVKERGLCLSSLDRAERKAASAYLKQLAVYAAESGYRTFCVPCGNDCLPEQREEAKQVLAEEIVTLADFFRTLALNLTIEPLDRYAYKKQLIGPMPEVIQWFAPIRAACSNAFIHWDSAHEALGEIDLLHSLMLTDGCLAQLHLANAILDRSHPCFGDLHMEVGRAPDFETEGFLNLQQGAAILKKAAQLTSAEGVQQVYASMEILGHAGDDLWRKEENGRVYLQAAWQLAGLPLCE